MPWTAIEQGDLEAIARAFHAEHDRLYGYDLRREGTALELINVRVRSVGRTDKPSLPRIAEGGADPASAFRGSRRAFVPEWDVFEDVAVYDGHRLRAGNVIRGPALIERSDTTVLVSAGFTAGVDVHGSCLLVADDAEA